MNKEEKINYDAFVLAYGKGRQKKWSLERLIIDTLYKTTNENIQYIKVDDINCFGKADEETDSYLIYRYGYLYRMPKTEIDLIINKKNGKMQLKKVGIGYGYDNVEKTLYQEIEQQIKNKHIYFRTNFNCEEFLIR